jgi:YggT family protein
MIFLVNFMKGVAWVLNNILWFMMLVIIGRAIISWLNADPYNPIVRFITSLSEPPCRWVRRYLPSVFGGIDLSPMIVLLVIGFLQYVLVLNLEQYAMQLERSLFLSRP